MTPIHGDLLTIVSSQPWKDIPGQRRMQFYGYTYDYLRRIHEDGLSPRTPSQLAVNRYAPGEGIFTHVDADIFDDVVGISLGSACVMDFADSESDETARRAVGRVDGQTIQRGRRVSLTFRNVK